MDVEWVARSPIRPPRRPRSVQGLRLELKMAHLHDEPGFWIHAVGYDDVYADFENHWEPPGELECQVYFLDVTRHHESWRPLLQGSRTKVEANGHKCGDPETIANV